MVFGTSLHYVNSLFDIQGMIKEEPAQYTHHWWKNYLASRVAANDDPYLRQLLAFAEKYGEDGAGLIPVHLTQGDIADLVGASRKRVNQVMVFFREQEFISLNTAGKIVVLNREALARYCR